MDQARLQKGPWLLATCATALLMGVPAAPAPAATGDLYVVDRDAYAAAKGGVMRIQVNKSGKRVTISENGAPTAAPTFAEPLGLAFDQAGSLVVSRAFETGGGVGTVGLIGVSPSSGVRTEFSVTSSTYNVPPNDPPAFGLPQGVAADLNGDMLVTDPIIKAVVRVAKGSGARSIVTDNTFPGHPLVDPVDVDVRANGDILVLDRDILCAVTATSRECGGILRVDPNPGPTAGARTVLSSNKTPAAGPKFNSPNGFTVAPDAFVYVANGEGKNVITVNPAQTNANGNKTLLSDNNSAGTPDYEVPNDIVSSGPDDDLYLTDGGATPNVIRVNTAGKRFLVSDNANLPGPPDFVEPWGIVFQPISGSPASVSPRSFQPELIDKTTGVKVSATRGATFRYGLSEAAKMTFTLWRRDGRRWVRVGSFAKESRKGSNSLRFSGRDRRKALRPGSYRAVLVARSKAGNRSLPQAVPFTILSG